MIGAWLQDLFGGAWNVGLGQHRQGEQREDGVVLGLPAQRLQAQPDHSTEKGLQLMRQQGRAQVETQVRHHHNHGQVLHLGMQLQKASSLGKEPVLDPPPV